MNKRLDDATPPDQAVTSVEAVDAEISITRVAHSPEGTHETVEEALFGGDRSSPAVLKHLETCARCTILADQLRELDQIGSELVQEPPPPAGLVDRVLVRLQKEAVIERHAATYVVPKAIQRGDASTPPQEMAVERPRILVVDSQSLFAAALSHMLSGPELGARMQAKQTTDAALEGLRRGEAVDLVVYDVRVGPSSFRDFLAEVGRLPETPPVILLADVLDQSILLAVLEKSAAGLFTKDAEPAEFLDGIRSVLRGHRALGSSVIKLLVAQMSGEDSAHTRPGLARLSRTEIEILAMAGKAMSIQSIAEARGISQKTVRNHLANIYRKLELRSRTQAMVAAARMGLLSGGYAPRSTWGDRRGRRGETMRLRT